MVCLPSPPGKRWGVFERLSAQVGGMAGCRDGGGRSAAGGWGLGLLEDSEASSLEPNLLHFLSLRG